MFNKESVLFSCEVANKFIDAYIADELPFFTRLSFKLHLMICKRCRVYFNQYKTSLMAVKYNRHSLRGNINTDMPDALKAAILKHIPKS